MRELTLRLNDDGSVYILANQIDDYRNWCDATGNMIEVSVVRAGVRIKVGDIMLHRTFCPPSDIVELVRQRREEALMDWYDHELARLSNPAPDLSKGKGLVAWQPTDEETKELVRLTKTRLSKLADAAAIQNAPDGGMVSISWPGLMAYADAGSWGVDNPSEEVKPDVVTGTMVQGSPDRTPGQP